MGSWRSSARATSGDIYTVTVDERALAEVADAGGAVRPDGPGVPGRSASCRTWTTVMAPSEHPALAAALESTARQVHDVPPDWQLLRRRRRARAVQAGRPVRDPLPAALRRPGGHRRSGRHDEDLHPRRQAVPGAARGAGRRRPPDPAARRGGGRLDRATARRRAGAAAGAHRGPRQQPRPRAGALRPARRAPRVRGGVRGGRPGRPGPGRAAHQRRRHRRPEPAHRSRRGREGGQARRAARAVRPRAGPRGRAGDRRAVRAPWRICRRTPFVPGTGATSRAS